MNGKYLRLYDDLRYDKAMLKARKVQSDEAKLRKLGGNGNYSNVQIHLTSDILGRKRYGIFVLPLEQSC